jgi:hypothetical protein
MCPERIDTYTWMVAFFFALSLQLLFLVVFLNFLLWLLSAPGLLVMIGHPESVSAWLASARDIVPSRAWWMRSLRILLVGPLLAIIGIVRDRFTGGDARLARDCTVCCGLARFQHAGGIPSAGAVMLLDAFGCDRAALRCPRHGPGPESSETEILLARFAPVLRLDSGETRRPYDVDVFVARSELLDARGRHAATAARLATATVSDHLRFRPLGDGATPPRRTPSRSTTTAVYTHAQQLDDDSFALEYWVFWVDNDLELRRSDVDLLRQYHVADWEGVILQVDRTTSGDWALSRVALSQHEWWRTLRADDVPRADGEHVEILVARGSHAHYVRDQREFFCAVESADGGTTLRPGPGYTLVPLDPAGWRSFPGRWGQSERSTDLTQRLFVTPSPTGPWTRPVYDNPRSVLDPGLHLGPGCQEGPASQAVCSLASLDADQMADQMVQAASLQHAVNNTWSSLQNVLSATAERSLVCTAAGLPSATTCVGTALTYCSNSLGCAAAVFYSVVCVGASSAACWLANNAVQTQTGSLLPQQPTPSFDQTRWRCVMRYQFTCGRNGRARPSC